MDFLVVLTASFAAGLVDAIVGGGGLILVPALFATYPAAVPATLLGTNKSASVWGTAIAALQFSRRVQFDWPVVLPAMVSALGGAFLGAWTVTRVDAGFLRLLLPVILLGVLVYTLAQKNLGALHAPRHATRHAAAIGCAIGALVGCYDGFFGPGAGSFFIFLLVRFLGYDFLHASATAKLLNVTTNLAALLLFGLKGHVWWRIGLMMAAANVAGSLLGSRLALKHGAGFVRTVFIVVVGALILKTGHDAFWR
jgi:uncharacterized membrane protein YfcA